MVSFCHCRITSKRTQDVRAMLHDPMDYPSPETFNPSRFLTASGQLNPKVKDPNSAFGFGRRLCPGRELAFDSMSINIASILATFDILPAVDENGVETVVSGEYSTGLMW
jgi:cytochrome P450